MLADGWNRAFGRGERVKGGKADDEITTIEELLVVAVRARVAYKGYECAEI